MLRVGGVKRGAAHAAGIGNGGDRRAELAGGEGVEGAEAVGEFGGGQAALAVEPAEKIFSEAISFQRIALDTARDEVAVGIAPQLNAGDDVVEGHQANGKAAQTVEAEATVAGVDGHAQRPGFHEIGVLQAGSAGQRGWGARCSNLHGQAHLDHVTGFGAGDQAQNALVGEAAHRVAHGIG